MDAVKFIEERRRMYTLGYIKHGIHDYNVKAEDVVAEVEEWSAAHPRKTRQSVFLEQYSEACVGDDGILHICPSNISAAYRNSVGGCYNPNNPCKACYKQFWMQEVE